MNINITARNFKISDELSELINDKLQKLYKYDSNITNINVVLIKESRAENCRCSFANKFKNFFKQ